MATNDLQFHLGQRHTEEQASGPSAQKIVSVMPQAVKEAARLRTHYEHALPPQGQQQHTQETMKFMCHDVPHEQWGAVKGLAILRLGVLGVATAIVDRLQHRSSLHEAVRMLQAVHSPIDECGLGRLCMSMLALLTGEVEPSLYNAPQIHSPLLTVLLDVPWTLTVSSKWPLFGLLAQLHLHSSGDDDFPAHGSEAEFFRKIPDHLQKRRWKELADHGARLLGQQRNHQSHSDGEGTATGNAHAMPTLSALASQLLSPDLREADQAKRALEQVQSVFRQCVQSAEDLHATIVSAWPLYSILHVAVLGLTEPVLH